MSFLQQPLFRNIFLATFLATIVLMGLATVVPFNYGYGSHEFYIRPPDSYFSSVIIPLAPRTIYYLLAMALKVDATQLAIIRYLFIFLWLAIISHQIISQHLTEQHGLLRRSYETIALVFIFGFGTTSYLTYAGFIDIFPSVFILVAYLLLKKYGPSYSIIFSSTILLTLSILFHERSFFYILILICWCLWYFGVKKTLRIMLPTMLAAKLFFILFGEVQSEGGLSPFAYINLIKDGPTYFLRNSFNILGILCGAGGIGLLYLVLAMQFVKQSVERRLIYKLIFLISMPMLVLLQLAIAHDTNRLVALIWFPTIILINEMNLKVALDRLRFANWAVVICIFSFLLPPMLMYQHGVVFFNCLGQKQVQEHVTGPVIRLNKMIFGKEWNQGMWATSTQPLTIYYHTGSNLTRHFTCD